LFLLTTDRYPPHSPNSTIGQQALPFFAPHFGRSDRPMQVLLPLYF
jgi:hypothetical protein